MERQYKTKQQNQTLDILKCVSCFIVICLHCRFPGVAGDMIIYALRFSVPVFFMVSGYYCFNRSGQWILIHIRKTLTAILITEAVSGLVNLCVKCLVFSVDIEDYLAETFSGFSPVKVIFFGSLFNGTLWYLYAMFWTWCILWLARRYNRMRLLYYLILPTLAIHILGRCYCQQYYDIEKLVFLFRSFLLFGLPFTSLGHFIAEHESLILSRLSRGRCLIIVFMGHCLIVCEYFISRQYMDLHFSTVVISVGLFLYTVVKPDTALFPGLQFIGEKLSGYIYYVHSIVITLIGAAAAEFSMEQALLYRWLRPVIVGAAATAIAWVLYRVKCLKHRPGKNQP